MPRSRARRAASSSASGDEPATAQPQPSKRVASPVTVWSGCSAKACAPDGSSALSGVAPLEWPTYGAEPATAAAAAGISESGTHMRIASAAFGTSPRASGSPASWPASASAAVRARPIRPAPTTAISATSRLRGGCGWSAIRSSSRMRNTGRLGGGTCGGYFSPRSVPTAVTASSGRLATTHAGKVTRVTPVERVGCAVMGRPAEERRAELVSLYRELNDQHGCPLSATRTHVVFGMGNADANRMLGGEARGATEDQEGKPFVGRAGRLLDELLGEIGLSRREVFIANILMCRPPGNRDPLPEEIEECKPYLMRKIELIE